MSYRRFFDLRPRAESDQILVDTIRILDSLAPSRDLPDGISTEDIAKVSSFDGSTLYHSPRDYFLYRAREALVSKNADISRPDLVVSPREAALLKFFEAERLCKSTNKRIYWESHIGTLCPDFASLVFLMQRKIATILGDAPRVEDLALKFGPGSSTNVRRKTSARYKLNAPVSCSRELESLYDILKESYPSWLGDQKPLILQGELTTVPKNAEIDRCILIEPILNTAIQLPIGSIMKRRLKRAGCDLFDQKRNQKLARQGSIDGSVATIDLSSASDLIAVMVVCLLLPIQWVELLSNCRTSQYTVKELGDRTLTFEKFSSMGNGFTFELESLIFFAAASACYEEAGLSTTNLSVYGDDIIVDTRVVSRLTSLLDYLGFVINSKKSCLAGPFRESCGGDYLNGINVRPFYVKGRMTSARIVAMINHYLHCPYPEIGYALLPVLLSYLPKRHRLWGPLGYGSGHICVPGLNPVKRHGRNKGWCGFSFSTFIQTPNRDEEPLQRGDALYPFYSQYMKEEDNPLPYQICRNIRGTRKVDLTDSTQWDFANNAHRQDDPYVLRGSHGERRIKIYIYDVPDSSVPICSQAKACRRKERRKMYLERCKAKSSV